MAFALTATTRTVRRGGCSRCPPLSIKCTQTNYHARTFINIFKRLGKKPQEAPPKQPILSQDNLFHPFSKSPFPAVRERGEAIKKLAPCPVCASSHEQGHPHVEQKHVQFECPDCGWPTHCSEEHWEADKNHQRYCGRLREVNEDEHDLRSGRRIKEFEMPGM